ncbi:MAG: 4Fe-4S binding protein [bacterium]
MSNEDILLPVERAGLMFRNPFIVASGPASKNIDQIVRAEGSGWGGISIKLTFDPEPYISRNPRYLWLRDRGIHIFTLETRLKLDEGLRLVEEGRRRTQEIVIFANITYSGEGGPWGWVNMARKFESAGAHAIELNFCCPNMSFNLDAMGGGDGSRPSSGASLGSNPEVVRSIAGAVKGGVGIPVFAKLTPEAGNIGDVARAAISAGADGVCGTGNRLGVPPIDIYHPERTAYRLQGGTSLGCISGPWLKPLALRDVLQMRRALGPEPTIVGTGGVRNFRDAVEMAMVGADLIGICTEVMLRGFDILHRIVRDTKKYLSEVGKDSFAEIRDLAIPGFKTAEELIVLPGRARVIGELCNGCGACARIAHCRAIELINEKAVVDAERCIACSTCVDICPRDAIEMVEGV